MGDNAEKVPCPEIIVFGNRDLERCDRVVALPFLEDDIRTAIGKIASHLEDLVRKIPGSMVENKGLTLSVYHRQAKGPGIPLDKGRAIMAF